VASYRSLTTVFARQRLLDHVFVAQTVLCGIDRAEPAEFEAVRHQRPTAPAQPRRPLTPEEIEGVALHPQERGALRQLLQAAAPALRKLFGRAARSVAKPRKITSRSHPELAAMIRAFSKAVGGAALNAYAVEGGVEQLRVEDTQPPSVFLGEDIDESEDELRFRAARLVARARLDHLLLLRLGAEDLGRVVAALISCACASYDPPLPAGDLEQVRAPLEKVLSKRARAAIEGPSLELLDRPLAPQRWLSWFLQSEDRLALSVTGDVLAAIEVLKKDEGATERLADDAGPRLRQLLNFAVADEHLTLRSRVGLAV